MMNNLYISEKGIYHIMQGRSRMMSSTDIMYNKDFDSWFRKKSEIENQSERPNYHEREVWWCSLGMNIGFEQDGKKDAIKRVAFGRTIFCPCKCRGEAEAISLPLHVAKEGSEDLKK